MADHRRGDPPTRSLESYCPENENDDSNVISGSGGSEEEANGREAPLPDPHRHRLPSGQVIDSKNTLQSHDSPAATEGVLPSPPLMTRSTSGGSSIGQRDNVIASGRDNHQDKIGRREQVFAVAQVLLATSEQQGTDVAATTATATATAAVIQPRPTSNSNGTRASTTGTTHLPRARTVEVAAAATPTADALDDDIGADWSRASLDIDMHPSSNNTATEVSAPDSFRQPGGGESGVGSNGKGNKDSSHSMDGRNNKRYMWCGILFLLMAVVLSMMAMALVFALCGTNGCRSGDNSDGSEKKERIVEMTNLIRQATLADHIHPYPDENDNDSLRGGAASRTATTTSLLLDPYDAENAALQWLIFTDPLILDPNESRDTWRILQRYALLALYFQQWTMASSSSSSSSGTTATTTATTSTWFHANGWLTNSDECSWFGINCVTVDDDSVDDAGQEQTARRVVSAIRLKAHSVHGTIPADLGLLTHMEIVVLSDNFLRGSLPSSLGQWSAVQHVHLARNQLAGTLPATLASWSPSLQVAFLCGNDFTESASSSNNSTNTVSQSVLTFLCQNQGAALRELRIDSNLVGSTSCPCCLGC